MKKYMKEYLTYLENLDGKKITDKELNNIVIKIGFFQHERLIHLIVTMFFALFTLGFAILGYMNNYFYIPFLILIIVLMFYIEHYYFLENKVQYMYKLYDKILSTKEKK